MFQNITKHEEYKTGLFLFEQFPNGLLNFRSLCIYMYVLSCLFSSLDTIMYIHTGKQWEEINFAGVICLFYLGFPLLVLALKKGTF